MLWYFISGRKTFTGPPVVSDADPTLKGQEVEGHVPSDEEAVVMSKEV